MSYLRRFADFPTEPGKHQPEFIARLESCSVVKGGIPAGTAADPLHSHPMDQFYYVLDGTVEVQLGSERVRAGENTLIRVPADTPHFAYNPGPGDVLQLELLVPTPLPASGGKMIPLVVLRDDPGGPPPAGCVGSISPDAWDDGSLDGPGESQLLAHRSTGSMHGWIAAERLVAGARSRLHVHDFDQLHFVLEGTLGAEIGGEGHVAGRHDLLMIPAQVPHRIWRDDPEPELHLTVVGPEPLSDPGDWSVSVEFFAAW